MLDRLERLVRLHRLTRSVNLDRLVKVAGLDIMLLRVDLFISISNVQRPSVLNSNFLA